MDQLIPKVVKLDESKITSVIRGIERNLLPTAIVAAVAQGDIEIDGLTDKEITVKVLKYLRIISSGKTDPRFLIDHGATILKWARSFKEHNHQMSALTYATWVEHLLNRFISYLLIRRKFEDKEILNVIRDVSIRAKMYWLLRILGVPPIHKPHRQNIERITEIRNAFVHYKWKSVEFNGNEEKDVVLGFERTVRYLQYYKSKYIIMGARKKIRRILKI